ncbi:PREDICTED: uncharacterized protein LOC109593816 isoform X2 [Amphimedon queenslandica]|uniref:Death domain-containing protein n=1 Tax=Amphimedon queenslandica TaxID=400682 RepID=A0AAN0K5C8_AMPQE|nr:PREDICTED: uncharacterized protein LOC109593816 isoform X2 [Amphimedon queenslandica]|eukprot:XP_019864475.1 PREDICTED: uncharacterized protein LOC109593816 isoform X2 [Amphimedon queenslandica]
MARLEDIRDELYRQLSPVAADWKVFGVQLGLELAELKKLEETSNKTSQACFQEMLSYWMENDGPHKWKEIFESLGCIHETGLAKKLRGCFAAEAQVELDLVDLTRELSKVEYCWSRFGTFLRVPRHKLKSIEGKKSNEEYLHDVIDMWCDKCECDYINLDRLEDVYSALEHISQSRRARELKAYFTAGRNQPPRRLVATDDNNTDNTINEEDELSRRLEDVNLNNEMPLPVEETCEGKTETSAFAKTSDIYQEPIDES